MFVHFLRPWLAKGDTLFYSVNDSSNALGSPGEVVLVAKSGLPPPGRARPLFEDSIVVGFLSALDLVDQAVLVEKAQCSFQGFRVKPGFLLYLFSGEGAVGVSEQEEYFGSGIG